MEKDWKGNKKSTFVTLGSTNHSETEREVNDYYATEPRAIDALMSIEKFSNSVWECACGGMHLSDRLQSLGFYVYSSDIIDRTNGRIDSITDFLNDNYNVSKGIDIITNPPFSKAEEFIRKALLTISDGDKCAFFLRIQILEGIKRKKLFEEYPPKVVAVFSKRIKCAKNGDFSLFKSSAAAYAWFIWEKGYKGETIVKWI